LNRDLSTLFLLRRVLEEIRGGRGLSGALVRVFHGAGQGLDAVAKETLLGRPPGEAMRGLLEEGGSEVGILAALVVNGTKGNARVTGRKGEELSRTLERWIKTREGRLMELRVLRFRGIVVSSVLGAVLGMISSVGPLVGNLNLSLTAPPPVPGYLGAAAAAMACLSSAMLGLFMTGRGFVLNVALTLGAFVLVGAAASPLTSVTAQSLWGIK
jgi:hypothetical protein